MTGVQTCALPIWVIGVAAGEKKVRAIRAALRTGSLNVLITDIGTAEKVLTQE